MLGFLYVLLFPAVVYFVFRALGKPGQAQTRLLDMYAVAWCIGGCGTFFAGTFIWDWDGWSGNSGFVLIIAVPSMAVGALIGLFGWRKFKRTRQKDETAGDGGDQ